MSVQNILHQSGMIKYFPQIPQINAENYQRKSAKSAGAINLNIINED